MEYDHIFHEIMHLNVTSNIFIHRYVSYFFLYFEIFVNYLQFHKPPFQVVIESYK